MDDVRVALQPTAKAICCNQIFKLLHLLLSACNCSQLIYILFYVLPFGTQMYLPHTNCPGHTSWSTSGLAYLSLWLAGKLRCFDGHGHPWKAIVSVMPTGLAVWIGITRLQVT